MFGLSIMVNLILAILLAWTFRCYRLKAREVERKAILPMNDGHAASAATIAAAASALDRMVAQTTTEDRINETAFVSLIMRSVDVEIERGHFLKGGDIHRQVAEFIDAFVRLTAYDAATSKKKITGTEFIRRSEIYEVEMMARPDHCDHFMAASAALRSYVHKLSCMTAGVPVFKSVSAKSAHNFLVQRVLIPALACASETK